MDVLVWELTLGRGVQKVQEEVFHQESDWLSLYLWQLFAHRSSSFEPELEKLCDQCYPYDHPI